MKALEWRVSFRPFKVLHNVALGASVSCLLWLPVNKTAIDDYQVARPSVELNPAVEKVRLEIEPRLTKLSPEESAMVAEVLVQECARTGFDPLFVIAVIQIESKFDVEAVSPTGARGLMQLVPKTFRAVSHAKRMLDPVENVRAGVRYLGRLVKSGFKRPESVLLAWNQGPGTAIAIRRDGAQEPYESTVFVPKVMAHYKTLLSKHGHSPVDASKLFLTLDTVAAN
jgi:soluble lytic murein transglycosylase-like protein